MAALTVQSLLSTVAQQSVGFAAAAAGGDTAPGGAVAGGWMRPLFLLVRNADAAPKTVTIPGHPQSPWVIPATTGFAVIPLIGGQNAIAYSAVTSVTVAVVSMQDALGG